jgi:mono/diheme cytochrome c family protein
VRRAHAHFVRNAPTSDATGCGVKTLFQLRFVRVTAVVLAVLAALVTGALVRAQWVFGRSYAHVPEPPIAADTSSAGVQRGEMLFESLCMECHAGQDGRASGKHLGEVPAFLGTLYSANLTDPQTGVHRQSDGQLARVLRFGVLSDGRLSPVMNAFGQLGDADVAAILGYMRSGAPVFTPGGAAQPRSRLSLVGSAILTYIAGVNVNRPSVGVPVPPKAPNVEYGRYMVQAMDCVGCHTDGFSSTKLTDQGAFAGGFELTDPTGAPIWTKNITFDEQTGIGRWAYEDFDRALRRGVTPDGHLVRKPMPLFARLDRTDVEAIFAYLQTVPRVQRANVPGGHPLARARANDPPETLFVNVGCAACHGDNGPFRDKLRAALSKSDAEVADWILDPQAIKPGSTMPSFQMTLDRGQAESLAKYVKEVARAAGG